ncbi:MAG TPA: YggT family protein [Pyrinomonadaceae bacterium]|jgi:YggT family protein|nr:YggT family protein [Pyrinomonadaceae bacterium]
MITGYLSTTVYPVIAMILWAVMLLFVALLVLRLLFSNADPNPFGAIGRFAFKIRKITERFVYPAARFLATFRVDIRLAPLITIFIALVLTYFLSQIIGNTCFVIDGLATGVVSGRPMVVVGFILYGLLSLFILAIFIRFLSSWFVFTRNTFLGFIKRVTDPIMIPVQKLIPPVGMFDLSAMIVLIVISLLQSVVLRLFVFN